MLEKIKDRIYGIIFLMMVMVGMFVTAFKGEMEDDENY